MKVLITGGTGRVGSAATKRLVAKGWDVNVIGAEPESTIAGITYFHCDIMDYDAVYHAAAGCEAIVHLAAIPSPRSHPLHEMFTINVAGTNVVFDVAARAGIKRVVQASSINALGCAWNIEDMHLEYFPIDEAHPIYTTDPYSFSKEMVENIGDYYWRRDGISSVGLRLPWVLTDDLFRDMERTEQRQVNRQRIEDLLTQPEAEQKRLIAEARSKALEYRAQRPLEYDQLQSGLSATIEPPAEDWLLRNYAFDRFNFWAYIHADDSAQAIEKSITADYEGAHPLYVNADSNWLNMESEALLKLFFGDIPARTRPLIGTETLVSNQTAEQLIGYAPDYRME